MMSGRYAKLTKDWSLRGWMDIQWAAVNWTNAKLFKLSKKRFYVAKACDGQTDFDSMAFLPEHIAFLDVMIKRGIARECHSGDLIKSWQQYRKADNPFLKEVQWCVTGFCNLNCRHCYMQSPSGRYGELPFKDMVYLIGQFEKANVTQVSITGGEPFMRKDLLDIMNILAKKRIWVSQIYTNGLLITKGILDRIKRIGFAPIFQLSFDGVGGHDYMRGTKGVEKHVIQAICKVRAAGFPVIVATNIDRVNFGCLGKTYGLLRGLDIQAWRIGAPLPMGNWRGASTDLSFQEKKDAYSQLLDQWLKDGRPFELVLGLFLRASMKANPEVAEEPKIFHTPESYDCGSCRENPTLLPDGTLLPCPGYVDSVLQNHMPNILSESLSKAWSESFLRTLINMKKTDLLAWNLDCRRCKFFGSCGMGCRASALRETGNLMAKDPVACKLWKEGYKQYFQARLG